MPLTLSLGAGEIELEIERPSGGTETPSASIDFHLDPDVDGLDSNCARAAQYFADLKVIHRVAVDTAR